MLSETENSNSAKKYFYFTLLFFLLILQFKAYGQVKNLFINSYDNIVKLNTTVSPPILEYTNISNGFEAIAHAEDKAGNILFFVNANGVYNRNGQLMEGSEGIYANSSSSEINICQLPEDESKYYIIYNSELCSPLYYSIVDMNKGDNLGALTSLNIVIDSSQIAEGVELIKIPCTNNYWLIAYQCNVGFKKYLINKKGISNGELIYQYSGPEIYLGRGELDYHNGKIGFAFANTPEPIVFLGELDSKTGLLYNVLNIQIPKGGNGVNGLEFSPDASKVYISHWYNKQTANLFQYDFETGVTKSFFISPSTDSKNGNGLGQIELGADGKLYIPIDSSKQITVIENPNSTSPVFSKIKTKSTLAIGVSDHIQSDILKTGNNFTFKNVCFNDDTYFTFQPNGCASKELKVQWDFGDNESRKKNKSSELSPKHRFSKTGIYNVTLIVHDNGITDTILHKVIISEKVQLNLGKDLNICQGDSILLDAGVSAQSYHWSVNSQQKQLTIKQPGKYWINVSNWGCTTSDTILINGLPKPELNLGEDMYLCDKKSQELSAPLGLKSYAWSTGETANKIKVTTSGEYSLTASNGFCSVNDTIEVIFNTYPKVNLGNDTIVCSGKTLTLDAGSDGDYYFWSTESKSQQIKVNKNGIYTVSVVKTTCVKNDTIQVLFNSFIPTITVEETLLIENKPSLLEIETNNIKTFHLKIFHPQTKKIIFESYHIKKSWNGQLPDLKNAPTGIYPYIIEYQGICNENILLKKGVISVKNNSKITQQ
ncbi:MAG: PKD domain-containing protein [Bacteroidia bacterium]